MKWKLQIGIILCVFTTAVAAYFISNHRAIDTPIKDVVTPKDTAEQKTEIQPGTSDNKMKQADFDRIMSEIAMSSPTHNQVTTSSDAITSMLNPHWMPWDEYKHASPEARKAITDHFKESGSVEASMERLIKEYDENFDLESIIRSSPELQAIWKAGRERSEKVDEEIQAIEDQIEALHTYGTFLFDEAKRRGAILIYDENGRPIGYEKDEQGNPILMSVTEYTRPLENEPKANKTVPIQTPARNNNVTPTISDLEFKVTKLWIKTSEQYPDAIISKHLSKEEFDTFFPTQELRQSLEERKTRMQNDIVIEIQGILSSNAFRDREQVIPPLRKYLSKNWDRDFADAVINRLETVGDE